jgi:hypothetical protein
MKIFLTICWTYFVSISFSQQIKIDFKPLCPEETINPIYSNWKTIGPFQDAANLPQNIGLVSCFALHPFNANIVYLGSNTGGVYKTENFQDSIPVWKHCTKNLRLPGLGISQICINPINPSILYASTGFASGIGEGVSAGVIKSIDGGLNWFPIGPHFPKDKSVPTRLVMDRTNQKNLFYSVVDEVYISTNDGQSWKLMFKLPPSKGLNKYNLNQLSRSIVDIEQSYANPAIWFISTDYTGTDDQVDACLLFKSTDYGFTWNQLPISKSIKTDKMVMATSPLLTNSLWLTYSFKENGKLQNKILKSPNQGESWIEVSAVQIAGAGYHRQDLELSPIDTNVLYVGGFYLSKSNDGGKTFFSNSKGLHVDTRYVKIFKSTTNQDVIVLANDGGIALSEDQFKTWKNKNGVGLNIKQFLGIAVGNRSKNLIAGGTQDNDISIYDKEWFIPQLTNDGADAIVNNQDESKIFAEPWCCDASQLQVRLYKKTNNKWKILNYFPPPELEGNNLRPIKQFENGTLVIGYHDVWKSSPNDIKWRKIANFSTVFDIPKSAKIKQMAIVRRDSSKIAVLYSGPSWSDELKEGYVFLTKTGGGLGKKDWFDVTQNLPIVVPRWIEMNCIEIDQNNQRDVFIGMNFVFPSTDSISNPYPNNGQYRIIKSKNFGQTWEDYSTNLPPYPVRDIISEEGINGGVYAATDVGVYYTNNTIYDQYGWICFSSNLPVTMVTDLEINYCTKEIVAGTFGHGVWVSDLASSREDLFQIESHEFKGEAIWSGNRDLNTDFYIRKNSKLTLKNASVAMAKDACIIIEEGAQLILDNSTIANFCEQNWKGVKIAKKRKRFLKSKEAGKVILLNNSSILE